MFSALKKLVGSEPAPGREKNIPAGLQSMNQALQRRFAKGVQYNSECGAWGVGSAEASPGSAGCLWGPGGLAVCRVTFQGVLSPGLCRHVAGAPLGPVGRPRGTLARLETCLWFAGCRWPGRLPFQVRPAAPGLAQVTWAERGSYITWGELRGP